MAAYQFRCKGWPFFAYQPQERLVECARRLRVKDFAAIVTMDAHGNSLHADVERQTGEALATLRKA
jgi:tartrate dehydratase beta subunit/fumarate hydratase class I family protein